MRLTWKQRLTGTAPSPQPPSPPPPAIGSWSGMQLRHWHHSDPHIAYARDLFQQPHFRDLLAVLINSRPRSHISDSPTEAAIQLGIQQGWDMLLGLLLSMPELPPTPAEEVPATYGAESFNLT